MIVCVIVVITVVVMSVDSLTRSLQGIRLREAGKPPYEQRHNY